MKITPEYVFFWNGIYSQWHKAPMTIDRVDFVTCEQYMMYQKAMLFKDKDIAHQILMTNNAKEQKSLGRMVQNFDKAVWDKACLGIVYKGNYAKFSQNEELMEELLSTGDRILVEASPLDSIWGIGMAEDEEGIEDPANWKGLNLLGQAITLVKQKLK